MPRRSLTEEEAKKIADKHMKYTRGTIYIYITGFAADISQYLGHRHTVCIVTPRIN
jgi:hypothetical protein